MVTERSMHLPSSPEGYRRSMLAPFFTEMSIDPISTRQSDADTTSTSPARDIVSDDTGEYAVKWESGSAVSTRRTAETPVMLVALPDTMVNSTSTGASGSLMVSSESTVRLRTEAPSNTMETDPSTSVQSTRVRSEFCLYLWTVCVWPSGPGSARRLVTRTEPSSSVTMMSASGYSSWGSASSSPSAATADETGTMRSNRTATAMTATGSLFITGQGTDQLKMDSPGRTAPA